MASRHEVASEELAMKMRLEPSLEEGARKIFRQMSADLQKTYANDGTVIPASEYEDEWRALLRSHYRRTVKYFGQSIRRQAKFVKLDVVAKDYGAVDGGIDAALVEFIRVEVDKSVMAISTTNAKGLAEAVADAVANALRDGGQPMSADVAASAARTFKEDGYARANTIAITETQNAAEGSKFVELSGLVDGGATVGDVPITDATTRTWTTILDSRTREPHAFADGQRRNVHEAFDVMGERLMYPRDMSLGASLENVINCRCCATTILELPPTAE